MTESWAVANDLADRLCFSCLRLLQYFILKEIQCGSKALFE